MTSKEDSRIMGYTLNAFKILCQAFTECPVLTTSEVEYEFTWHHKHFKDWLCDWIVCERHQGSKL